MFPFVRRPSVEELTLSQEGRPQTNYSASQILRQMGLSLPFVVHIIHRDLRMKKRHVQELRDE